MPCTKLHPLLQDRGNIQKSLESQPVFIVLENMLYILVLLRSQICEPPLLEAEVDIKMILAHFEVDFAVAEPLLVGVVVDQTSFELRTDV